MIKMRKKILLSYFAFFSIFIFSTANATSTNQSSPITGGHMIESDGDGNGEHNHHHMIMGHDCPADAKATSLLTVADFNGDGIVDEGDINLLKQQLKDQKYEAIMDRNADGILNDLDLDLAKKDLGKKSSDFDHQLVTIVKVSEQYKDIKKAIADGYRPFTQTLKGHGIHYGRLPIKYQSTGILDPNYKNILGENPEIAVPTGLNYDEKGNLLAVFYLRSIDVKKWILTRNEDRGPLMARGMRITKEMPKLFASPDESWHTHYGACWIGLNY
ncbi:MAG: hypothetical protein HQK51_18690, partial [Oligoflexia bacterium]|nr:hypothetical protein [Oligoflexia bacterium]